ncbi:hypothetical protein FOCC_FOCC002024 [Frankliniella occidentalis]|nr:hypothetical protein FOCC_FOCC002024 [Frankliniella occidentalis]
MSSAASRLVCVPVPAAPSNAIPGAPSKAGTPRPASAPGLPRSAQQVEDAASAPAPGDDQDADDDLDDLTQINCTVTIFTGEKQGPARVIGVLSEWINTYSFMRQNQEKLYLYLTLSVSGGLLLFLVLVVGRLLVQRHRSRSEAKFRAANAAPDRLPNGFADDISEIDADIDLTTPVAVPVVAVHSPPRHEPAERFACAAGRGGGRGGGAGDLDMDAYMLEDSQVRRTRGGGLMLPGDAEAEPLDVDVLAAALRPPPPPGRVAPAEPATGTLTRSGAKRRVTFSSDPPDVSVVPSVPDVALELELDELCVKL